MRFFYTTPTKSHVYTELERLRSLGLTDVVDGTGGRRARRHRITPFGWAELVRWLEEAPLEPMVIKHPAALSLFLGHLTTPARLRAVLEEHKATVEQLLFDLNAVEADLGDGPGPLPKLSRRSPGRVT